ncbi:MAG: NAD(P)-dependent oxidoreductase, partial [Clostridium sp.]
MGYFPFYMDIEGKLCVIAGGGKVAYRKVCDLL